MNCIFSTLKFVSNLAYSLGTPTIITFDQPLFWNASKIMQNPANPVVKKIIVKLGTFRTDMNLLLCHWYDHGKHWLKKCVKNDIKENSALHIPKGKAVSRALRSHYVIHQCLSTLIAEKFTFIQEDITLNLS